MACERIREELARILRHGRPTQVLDLLRQLKLFPMMWRDEGTKAPDAERLALTLGAYERAEEHCRRLVGRFPDRLLSVHALIAHEFSSTTARAVSQRNRLVTRTQARAIDSLATLDPGELGGNPRRFLALWGQSWLEAAVVTASLADGSDSRLATWLERLRTLVEKAPVLPVPVRAEHRWPLSAIQA